MSLLIKGVEIPKSCWFCWLFRHNNSEFFRCPITHRSVENCSKNRHKTCPLVEINTPHGRLIDENEVVKIVKDMHGLCRHDVLIDAIDRIQKLPTIIEAEGL